MLHRQHDLASSSINSADSIPQSRLAQVYRLAFGRIGYPSRELAPANRVFQKIACMLTLSGKC